jgi:hypothetical protein
MSLLVTLFELRLRHLVTSESLKGSAHLYKDEDWMTEEVA